MTSPRAAVARVLARWLTLHDPPAVPERDAREWRELTGRDRAFAFDLLTGVIRWRHTLDAVIASRLTSPFEKIEPKVQAVLRVGAYQLLMHAGTQSYAAVDSSVELSREIGAGRAAGLVNAVLRNITRLKPTAEPRQALSASAFPLDFTTQIRFSENLFPDPAQDVVAHLAAATSHPRGLVQALIEWHTQPVAINLMIRNNQRPAIVLRADDAAFVPPTVAGLSPHEEPGYFVAARGWNETIESLVKRGDLSPQDPTAGKVVRRLKEAIQPKRVLDLCAGLGTKTIQMARLWPDAEVVAHDIDRAKLERAMGRVAETGVKNVRALNAGDGGCFAERMGLDLVLVDAPCSNTGVMARRVQSRWRWPRLNVESLLTTQRALIDQARALVKPGGIVAYATCSIDPRENDRLVKESKRDTGSSVDIFAEDLTLPAAIDDATRAHDGGYLAVLRMSA